MKIPEITIPMVEEALGYEWALTSQNCHGVSLGLVKAKPEWLPKNARVARGRHKAIMSQHSWITCGDAYDPRSTIIDATLWSYDPSVSGVFVTKASNKRYIPHGGVGTVWQCERPSEPEYPVMTLSPEEYEKLPDDAKRFLRLCGPLDARGWGLLANYPARGWPSSAIWAAMYRSPGVRAYVQIDRVGMATDCDPGGVYMGTEQVGEDFQD